MILVWHAVQNKLHSNPNRKTGKLKPPELVDLSLQVLLELVLKIASKSHPKLEGPLQGEERKEKFPRKTWHFKMVDTATKP